MAASGVMFTGPFVQGLYERGFSEPRYFTQIRADRELLLRHDDSVSSVAFLADGKTLLSAGHDQKVRLWDVRTGKERRRLDLAKPAQVMLSADGKVLVTRRMDAVVQVWDTATGKELFPAKDRKVFRLPPCALSPDGKTLAAFVRDGSIELWDLASRRKTRSFSGDRPTHSRFPLIEDTVSFAPDGKTLATLSTSLPVGSNEFTLVVQIWDVTGGKRRHCLDLSAGHSPTALPAFSPDGKLLAWANGEHATLLDVSSGKDVRRFESRSARLDDVVFSPDGKTLYSQSRMDRTVRAWDVASGKERRLAPSPRRQVMGELSASRPLCRLLAVSPDGKLLACSGAGSTIRLLDARTGKEALSFSGHCGPIFALGYGRDGKTLTTQGYDGMALVWDVATGAETGRLRAPADVSTWLLSPDGKMIVSEGQADSVSLWDAATGKERHQLIKGKPTRRFWFIHSPGFVFAPNGKLLAVRGSADTTIRLFDLRTGKEVRTFAPPPTLPPQASPKALPRPLAVPAFSPDGKVLAAPIHDDAVVLWDSASGRELRRLRLKKGKKVSWLTFAPDGRSLALDMGQGNVAVWETETGGRRRLYGQPAKKGEMLPVSAPVVVFSSDGRTLALATKGKVRVWDVLTGKERGPFRGQQGDVRALAFSPDGRTLASAGADGTALLWDVANSGRRGK